MNLNRMLDVGLGKIPPQALDVEIAILGAMLIEAEAMRLVVPILHTSEVFYKEAHQRIYRACLLLYSTSQPVDLLTVVAQLRSTGELELAGGPMYITELTSRINSAANIEYHARIVLQKWMLRQLITMSCDIQRHAYNDAVDVFDLMGNIEQSFFQISDVLSKKKAMTLLHLLPESFLDIEKAMNNDGKPTGVPSGILSLDTVTGGWQNSDYIVLAARPGMGKTACVVTFARNAAVIHKKPVAIFSLEMSNKQLVNRLISLETEISNSDLKKGAISIDQLDYIHQQCARLATEMILLDDSPSLNILELKAKCQRLKQRYGIQLIIIDYLQLVQAKADKNKQTNREQEIATISRTCKAIAKELDIPVMALSQLSREVEKRADKRPQLSDLRESGSIEQDADMVMFLYRPEYYGILQDESGGSLVNTCELIIAKHRNGSPADLMLGCKVMYSKFTDLYRPPPPSPSIGEHYPNQIIPPRLPFSGDDMDNFEKRSNGSNNIEPDF